MDKDMKRMTPPLISLKRSARMAFAVALVTLGGAALWATLQPLAGAVVAGGTFKVESNVKKIQHQTGGIVKTLAVAEGARVKAGDLLVRLDDTMARAELGIVMNDLVSQRARLARLIAERDQVGEIAFPQDLIAEAGANEATRAVLDSETRVRATRLTLLQGQKAQLKERISQLRQQAEGYAAQKKALEDQRKLAVADQTSLKPLLAKDLVPRTRTSELQREIVKLDGSIGSAAAQIAELGGKQAELELQILGLDRDLNMEVAKDIRETEARIGELNERRIAAEDRMKHTTIRAPEEGIVYALNFHTVGGVVAPGETLMLIVPQSEPLLVEAKVRPTDIDQVHVGQETRLILSAFNQRTTPEVRGAVFRVAADLTSEERTGLSYYLVGIKIPEEEIKTLGSLRLMSGMPVEAYIQTGERSVASYLLKPLANHMNRAMREE